MQSAPKTSTFTDDDQEISNNSFLHQLADKSGGKFYDVGSVNLSKSLNEIISELSHTYSLAYYPSNQTQNNETKKIKVELNNKKANLHYKRTYETKTRK